MAAPAACFLWQTASLHLLSPQAIRREALEAAMRKQRDDYEKRRLEVRQFHDTSLGAAPYCVC